MDSQNIENFLLKLYCDHISPNKRDWIWPKPNCKQEPHSQPLHSDPKLGWDFCKKFYGDDFHIQKIRFNLKKFKPYYGFKEYCMLWQEGKEDWRWYKYMWLINDYFLNKDFYYPSQIIYYPRTFSWCANPGVLRYNIIHLSGVEEVDMLYHSIFKKKVNVIEKYHSLEELAYGHNSTIENLHIRLCWFHKKPLAEINFFHNSADLWNHINDRRNIHKLIFEKNIANGIYINCDSSIEKILMKEIDTWPDNQLSDKIVFGSNKSQLSIYTKDIESFYLGLYLYGTNIKNIELKKMNIEYRG